MQLSDLCSLPFEKYYKTGHSFNQLRSKGICLINFDEKKNVLQYEDQNY
jgi:hypothetical protein